MRRLPIAFLLSAILALACWIVPPFAGVSVDWRLPIAAFAIMATAVILTAPPAKPDPTDESPQAMDTDFRLPPDR